MVTVRTAVTSFISTLHTGAGHKSVCGGSAPASFTGIAFTKNLKKMLVPGTAFGIPFT
jgi:hypothetical protein